MSPVPGHSVTIGERAAARSAAPSTANGFIVGFTERGPTDRAELSRSLSEWVETYGERTVPGLYDSVDVAFREGLSELYTAREVGPTPVKATGNVIGVSDAATLRADAKSVGVWGNSITIDAVLTAGSFVLTIKYAGTVVEISPALANEAAAIAWATASSAYIDLVDVGIAEDVKTQSAVALAAGTDDNTNATDATRQAALDLFAKDLGPGQVAAPGFTTSQAYLDLLAHAAGTNRRALLDGADTADEAVLAAAATALRDVDGDRFSAMLAPWAIVPGLSQGTTRTVPYSAVQLGLIARAEAESGNPNRAAAGPRGRARYATDLTQSYTEAQRETLNNAGVTAAILHRGIVTTYGNRTLVNPSTNGDWKWFSASRLVMGVAALADLVLEGYDFEQIDGKGFVFAKLQGDLSGRACMPFYLADALYGSTPDEAFLVNTGPDVNTPTTIAAGEIHAQIGIRVSESGEVLNVEVVKIPTTEAIA